MQAKPGLTLTRVSVPDMACFIPCLALCIGYSYVELTRERFTVAKATVEVPVGSRTIPLRVLWVGVSAVQLFLLYRPTECRTVPVSP